ncbi:hypothetical protein EVAR_38776_1 [Eumeta japonica]|uniref:Uncharacterized protein n=1 Tax=Eumeta variegata TaxID=151549 RepID=A0A4C1WLK5_EUMVA|nr:hypothetical protein EVAR_38776_1 [Eumeta japonica]
MIRKEESELVYGTIFLGGALDFSEVLMSAIFFGTKFLTAGLKEIGILLRDRTEKNVIIKPTERNLLCEARSEGSDLTSVKNLIDPPVVRVPQSVSHPTRGQNALARRPAALPTSDQRLPVYSQIDPFT